MADGDSERRRRTFASLSRIGAALAGLGAGVIPAHRLETMQWPILGVGVAVHLPGMIETRRLRNESGHAPSAFDQVMFWNCWLMIAALAVYSAQALL